MSARNYFDIRYSMPGFTFLLEVILINIIPLYNYLLDKNQLGLPFSILSIFISQCFGFYIGQIWWRHFHNNYEYNIREGIYRIPMQYIIEKFYNNNQEDAINPRALSLYGYIAHYLMTCKKNKEILNYTTRRWDLYHLLKITLLAIRMGFICGSLINIIYSFFSKNIITLMMIYTMCFISVYIQGVIYSDLQTIITEYGDVTFMVFNTLSDDDIKEIQKYFDNLQLITALPMYMQDRT